jgi:hypothetical protein
MQAGMGGAPRSGAALAIHPVATVEDFEILRRIGIVSVKVWLLGAMATGASLFDALNVEGETMTAFACGLGRMGNGMFDAIITLTIVLGSALTLVAVMVAAVIRKFKS